MLMVGSLFAGIGGIDLGLERAGMQVKWQVENNPYCIRVLEKHWPSIKRYGDIKQVDWSQVEPVDLICGGFPCQPVSVAGARKGDKDERWLWPEFLRAIREVRPKYALVENVPGLLSTDDGRLARGVFGDLAEIGYDAEWNIVSAADVGAPHRRQRIFIVAYTKSDGNCVRHGPDRGKDTNRQRRNKVRGKFVLSSEVENSRCLAGQERAEVEGILSGFVGEGDS
jgi:DNA (cytosine-5)-methyltransferase 1